MSNEDLLKAIHALLDGKEWTPDTLDDIAVLLNDNGYPIRDLLIEESEPEGREGYSHE